MKKYGDVFFSGATICPYIKSETSTHENFFALDLNASETDHILAHGWRKFGAHFFRPKCESCHACTPLRVRVQDFEMSREQRRIWRKGEKIESAFHPLAYNPKLFEIYQKHSREKFQSVPITDEKEFLEAFFIASTPALGHSLFSGGELIASGFLDLGERSMSSVYFFYDPSHSKHSLGTLAILREIDKARQLNLSHYYLGYHISENQHMSYKAKFSPHELYDWYNKSWK